MRRREFITTFGTAASWPLTARPQQKAVPVVGFVLRQLCLSAAFALVASISSAYAASWDPLKEQRALQRMRQFQAQNQVPMLATSVVIDGKVVLSKGIGAGGSIVPDGKKIRYHIGSVTKQFTAAAVLNLIEDGTIVPSTGVPLALDTTLIELAPSIRRSEVGKITIRRLLTMTSNFPNYTGDSFLYTAGAGVIELLKTYQLTEPAGKFEYSNTNYFILALAIQLLKGGDLTNTPVVHNYIRQRILAKAGMTTTGFYGEPAPPGVHDAAPHYLRDPLFHQGDWLLGSGDVISSVAEMALWQIALTEGRVLGLASVKTMLSPAAPPVTQSQVYVGCRYAMGWYACERANH